MNPILDSSYRDRFADNTRLPPTTYVSCQGLAAAIIEAGETWRPTFSELAGLLRSSDRTVSKALLAAGFAFAAAKSIESGFPGPAILLYVAALDRLGTEPNVDLQKAIVSAKKRLKGAGLHDDPDIRAVLEAAHNRATMDRVRAKLCRELHAGLVRAGRLPLDRIDPTVQEIVRIANETRHEALIDRHAAKKIEPTRDADGTPVYSINVREIPDAEPYTDPFYEFPTGHFIAIRSFLGELVPHAREGSAHAIVKRILDIQESHRLP